mmetsp:Transcript_14472/g.22445  ORF Transcript_14472/g.22445 Transcript_14472/m.22445 type:complete len:145 (+) Transcript_14472:3675-4109(+)
MPAKRTKTKPKPKLFSSTTQGLDSSSEEADSSCSEEEKTNDNLLLPKFPKKIAPEYHSEVNKKTTIKAKSENIMLGKSQETKIAGALKQNSNDNSAGLGKAVENRFDMQYNLMSLVSQLKNIINIEIIIDRKTKQKKQLDATMI